MNKIISYLVIVIFLSSCAGSRISKKSVSTDKEKFHIYLLMGQSNMAGRGILEAVDTMTHTRVFMLNQDTSWVLAKNPIHFDKPRVVGTGLGLEFGKIMADENKEIKIGLVPCAKGGSAINQWYQDSLHSQTKSYPYNEMIFKAKKAMEVGIIKGILWHQGESDANSEESIEIYAAKFNELLSNTFRDLDIDPVPVVIGEIGHFQYKKKPLAIKLNAEFEQIAISNPCIGLVTSENLNHKGDTTHFDAQSYRELGRRYAAEMIEIQSVCPMK